MSKKSLARLIRIVTGTFGGGRDEVFSLNESLTKFERFVHFWVLVARSFVRNRCPIRASALSYTTLLALIPMLAVAMSISSLFLKSQGEKEIGAFIEQFIAHVIPDKLNEPIDESDLESTNAAAQSVTNDTNFVANISERATNSAAEPGKTDYDFENTNTAVQLVNDGTNLDATISATGTNAPVDTGSLVKDARVVAAKKRAAAQIRQFIQNAYSGTLGTVGVIILLWTAIVMLTRVEETFNDIWGVTQGRGWLSRIVLYWSTITLGPLLLVGALGLANGKHFEKTRELINTVPLMQPLIEQLIPITLISITFALFYKLMPNTKVHFRAALVGGVLAGTTWHSFNLLTFYLSSRAVNASKIYGSLALVPLLMVGLYVVWIIVLFGAQVAYAFQNRESYLQERLSENVNQRGREFIALRLMTCIGQHFERGLPPATIPQMSRELGIPSKLIQQVLATLLAARLVVEVAGAEPGYSPARPLDTINCHHILLAMRATQGQELLTREEPVREEVYGEFARIQTAERDAASSVTMLALVSRAQARLELSPPEPVPAKKKSATQIEVSELPQEPATATAPESETKPVETTPETKSKSESIIASSKTSATDEEDQSFPL